MRQLIIARKDLGMSPGKLASQCCHASIAFITTPMFNLHFPTFSEGKIKVPVCMDKEIYDDWICDISTKTICEAKNRTQLLKAKTLALELGLVENEDFFLIKDRCLTELQPEEIDEDGIGRTLTCIGFRPLPDDVAQKISKRFQLYRDNTQRLIHTATTKLEELERSGIPDDVFENGVMQGEYNTWITVLDSLGVKHS